MNTATTSNERIKPPPLARRAPEKLVKSRDTRTVDHPAPESNSLFLDPTTKRQPKGGRGALPQIQL